MTRARRSGPIRRPRGMRGVALIEFALTLPFLLVCGLALIDLSRAFYLKSMVTAAAHEGARVAVVTPDPLDSPGLDSVTARVSKVLENTGMPSANVSVNVTGSTGDWVTSVRVSTTFEWLFLGALNYFGGAIANPESLTSVSAMHFES